MASHNEIRVGSVGEWVVRVDGVDVPVAVVEKIKKDSGRGYEFSVRRVDSIGRPHGRTLTRGSGAFRKPGQAARAFGGKAPTRNPAGRGVVAGEYRPPSKGPVTRRAPKPPARPKKATPKPKATVPAQPSLPSFSSTTAASLPSLRGQRKAKPKPSPQAQAEPRTRREGEFTVRPPNDLTRKLIKALDKSDGQAWTIRQVVSTVLAEHEFSQTYSWRR